MTIQVLRSGTLTSVQDRGRFGHAALGVGSAGPMDTIAFRLANALVGNPAHAAALEITLTGPRLRFDSTAHIALTGAHADLRINAKPVPTWRCIRVQAGDEFDCGRLLRGARSYLAISGGVRVAPMLGSRATDVNARLGPFGGRPLRADDTLSVDELSGSQPFASTNWSLDPRPWFAADSTQPIRLLRGNHFGALDGQSRTALFSSAYRIHADSNRVGYRLDGPPLRLTEALELVSEPVVAGTLQLPPMGQPIALMAEHPTTGGYPRIGQIAAVDMPRLAQKRPGDRIHFSEIDLDEAQTRYLDRERELTLLIDRITERLATHE